MTPEHQAVLQQVAAAVTEVVGDDLAFDGPLGMETAFNADLELESIEFVALAEVLQREYPGVDFVGWLSGLELDEIIALRLGDLVEFIVSCRS